MENSTLPWKKSSIFDFGIPLVWGKKTCPGTWKSRQSRKRGLSRTSSWQKLIHIYRRSGDRPRNFERTSLSGAFGLLLLLSSHLKVEPAQWYAGFSLNVAGCTPKHYAYSSVVKIWTHQNYMRHARSQRRAVNKNFAIYISPISRRFPNSNGRLYPIGVGARRVRRGP